MDDFEKSQDQPIMDDGDAQLDTEVWVVDNEI